MKRRILANLAAVTALVLLTGCGQSGSVAKAEPASSWDEIVQRANEEGAVTFYTHMDDPTSNRVKEAFSKKYPKIVPNFVHLTGSEIVPRVDAERKAKSKGADAMTTSMPNYLDGIIKDGQLAEIKGPDYQALQSTFAQHPGLAKGNLYAAHLGGSHLIVWNTNLVKEPIKSYQDLINRKDEFAGQIAAPDLYGDVAVTFYLGLQRGIEGKDSTDPSKSELLKGIASLKPRFFDSAVPLTNAVAAGEVKAGIYSADIVMQTLKAKGAPLDGAADPAAPTSVNSYAAVTGWATHPNAGQVLVNFLFSKEGQEAGGASRYTMIMPNIPNSPGDVNQLGIFPEEVKDPAFTEGYRTQWKSIFRK